MIFEGSVIREQGVTFAIVIVRQHVIHNTLEAQETIRAFQTQVFPGIPVVLMAQDGFGRPTYYGRQDIARFMANVPLAAVSWKQYTLS